MLKRIVAIGLVMLTASAALADLAGYWDFEEGAGATVADSSGNSNPGTLVAGDGSTFPDWVSGFDGSGSALQFNAATSGNSNSNSVRVDIDAADGLASLADAFTISLWVRREAESAIWPAVVYTDAYDYELAMDPNGNSANLESHDFIWSDLDADWRIDLGAESLDQQEMSVWNHIAISFDGNYLKKYVNGVMRYVSAPGIIFDAGATTDLYFAAKDDGSAYFVGALDDVAIWSGTYLPAAEIGKLADGTATPLTVQDAAAVPPLPPDYFTKEAEATIGGWKTLWCTGFTWDVNIQSNNTATAWWFDGSLLPGTRTSCWDMNKWFVKDMDSYVHPAKDMDRYGVEWIDPSWSGAAADVAVFAAYVTPGIAVCQYDKGYQRYRPDVYSWEDKDYFKTYARVAAVNAAGASLRVRSYSYEDGADYLDPASLTLLGQTVWPLDTVDDNVWQEIKHTFPKPTDGLGTTRVWIEVGVIGGSADTVMYIDDFYPVSDQPVTFSKVDFDKDSVVNQLDLTLLTVDWLYKGSIAEPREDGMLENGDFYKDIDELDPTDDYAWKAMTPTDWSFTPGGDTGIQRMAIRGTMNDVASVVVPMGGSVAAYTNEPNAVLSQTTVETMTEGTTYYAMGYVLTSSWYGWKDTAAMILEADGVELTRFSRPLSIERWRPVYGTYTATAADAGKPLTIKFSYTNTHTIELEEPGYLFVGYAYLGDTMPDAWPEARPNVLTNGGFEEIDWMVGTPYESVYASIMASDNWGAWFVDGIPAPPGWIYEVPAGFSLADKGGIWSSGMYGTPLPTPGMNDVCLYTSNDLILGQIVGSLQNGATYYLDMACGVLSGAYRDEENPVPWPNPAPTLNIELYRIPVGVTDPAIIQAAIASSNPSYVKIAEASVDAVGNIIGGTGVPASRWQLVGTTYTATAADTNVYLRVYGAGGADPMPEFAISDVYLSTQPRVVPGGDTAFDINPSLPYAVEGPYNCHHAGIMGVDAPVGDVDGNCFVDMTDYGLLVSGWLEAAWE